MGSGKSTAAKFLEDYGFKRFSFATKLKELATELFGMQGKNRKLLQDLGDALRGIEKDVFAKYLLLKIEQNEPTMINKKYCVVIDDMRYLNEAKLLREHGFVLIRLICLDEENRLKWLKDKGTLAGQDHPSETEQDQIQVDFEIQWKGLEDLKKQIRLVARLVIQNTPEASVERFDVKQDKVKLIQYVVDNCLERLAAKDLTEKQRQSYLRILNDCLKVMTKFKELDQVSEDDLAQLLSRIPKKWRFNASVELIRKIDKVWGDFHSNWLYTYFVIKHQLEEIENKKFAASVMIRDFADILIVIIRWLHEIGLDPEKVVLNRLQGRHKEHTKSIRRKYQRLYTEFLKQEKERLIYKL